MTNYDTISARDYILMFKGELYNIAETIKDEAVKRELMHLASSMEFPTLIRYYEGKIHKNFCPTENNYWTSQMVTIVRDRLYELYHSCLSYLKLERDKEDKMYEMFDAFWQDVLNCILYPKKDSRWVPSEYVLEEDMVKRIGKRSWKDKWWIFCRNLRKLFKNEL